MFFWGNEKKYFTHIQGLSQLQSKPFEWYRLYQCFPSEPFGSAVLRTTTTGKSLQPTPLLAARNEHLHYGNTSCRVFKGDIKLERFLTENQHTQRKLLNFKNWCNGEVSKKAKVWLSKSIFYVKNHWNLSLFFHWRISI